jgi:hypothetical protein
MASSSSTTSIGGKKKDSIQPDRGVVKSADIDEEEHVKSKDVCIGWSK